jgi:lipopolysaccharide/colanic/teichoic acid biosynthesis glycosyltransferase
VGTSQVETSQVAIAITPDYRLKRPFDLIASISALIVTLPVWVPVALAIRVESPGPILYRAKRMGRGGRPITVLKFRSMKVTSGGPAITAGTDSRITRVGKLIRLTKIDELPQLINVVRGDMSLVGPRPEDARYLDSYSEVERAVLGIRPGITGAASVAYRHEETILAAASDVEAEYRSTVLPAKLALELDYLRTRSLRTDVKWLLATVAAVFSSSER